MSLIGERSEVCKFILRMATTSQDASLDERRRRRLEREKQYELEQQQAEIERKKRQEERQRRREERKKSQLDLNSSSSSRDSTTKEVTQAPNTFSDNPQASTTIIENHKESNSKHCIFMC